MAELRAHLFRDPVRHALQSRHAHFSNRTCLASRYPPDVAPFASVDEPTSQAAEDLRALMAIGESVWIFEEKLPQVPGLAFETSLSMLQMVLPTDAVIPEPTGWVEPLTDPAEMVALTDVAFPGFFRPRTCEMGDYFGIRSDGDLISMAGERLLLDGYSEISGVCTHPAHRGQGHAATAIWEVARKHRREGVVSWLHVVAANQTALELYRSMGFATARQAMLHRVTRTA
jgi:ribosomal protein S18 acetylase RimI-like enzyme